ncbi:hypothetical protein FB382_003641 [Nocardioides ginsengisegetis]|uniref:Uncharacterized protein n=1 Tax=Nocardioides ginsengisegetis TaxID=661491 RepID=A0A7W3PB21_9ACTN|nr:hypothetical protein [Nocardioides ginsengisegetis]MBA8805350.1 hypothetical protein [Nocardioides ginsengisegetis]
MQISEPSRPVPRRRRGRASATALLLLATGLYAGLHSPWGTKHAEVKQGVAMRANDENGLVLFDADDGTQVDFDADRIWWEAGEVGSDGDPPCLRVPLLRTRVEVGVIRVAGPDGGWRTQAAWVKCL